MANVETVSVKKDIRTQEAHAEHKDGSHLIQVLKEKSDVIKASYKNRQENGTIVLTNYATGYNSHLHKEKYDYLDKILR